MEDYYIDRNSTVRKSVIVYKREGGCHSPIIYISKPKWRTDEEFNDFLDRMEIHVKQKNEK